MPIARPRKVIAQTNEFAHALEHAKAERRVAITRTSGTLTGVYPGRYLGLLRRDWPA